MNSFLGRGMVTFSRRPCPRAMEAASCFSFRPTSPRKGVFRMASPLPMLSTEPKGYDMILRALRCAKANGFTGEEG